MTGLEGEDEDRKTTQRWMASIQIAAQYCYIFISPRGLNFRGSGCSDRNNISPVGNIDVNNKWMCGSSTERVSLIAEEPQDLLLFAKCWREPGCWEGIRRTGQIEDGHPWRSQVWRLPSALGLNVIIVVSPRLDKPLECIPSQSKAFGTTNNAGSDYKCLCFYIFEAFPRCWITLTISSWTCPVMPMKPSHPPGFLERFANSNICCSQNYIIVNSSVQ